MSDVEVIRFEEGESDPPELDDLTVDPALWARLESYVCRRWGERQAVWTVKGPGEFIPHLLPVSISSVDLWDDVLFVWSAVTCSPTPFGIYLPSCGTYRITAVVGSDAPVPPLVVQAYERLHAYCQDAGGKSGYSQHSIKIGEGGIDEQVERTPAWMAKAIQLSGCGDLLRNFRRH